jgi:hypothetical protein
LDSELAVPMVLQPDKMANKERLTIVFAANLFFIIYTQINESKRVTQ